LRDDLSVGRAEQEQPTPSQPQSDAAAARAPSKSRSVPVERKLVGIDVLVGVLWTPRGERWEAAGGGSAGGGVGADDTGGCNTVERRSAEVVTPAFLALNKSPTKSCVISKKPIRRAQLPFKS
jgi:hypothetical protein